MTKSELIDKIKKEVDIMSEFLKGSKTLSLKYTIDDLTIYINPNRLTTGNVKLIDIFIFDTPAGSVEGSGTCRNCDTCKRSCYAAHQQLQYKYTRLFRLINHYMITYDSDFLLSLFEKQMSNVKKDIVTFRIHSSGDFFNQNEIDFWNNFIQKYPKIDFYAYTKVDTIDNFNEIEQKNNFNLIRSLIEHNGVRYRNYGSIDYVARIARKVGGFVCPATVPGSNIKCNKGCRYCINHDKALFVIHGTYENVNKRKKTIKPQELFEITEVNKKIDHDFFLNLAS